MDLLGNIFGIKAEYKNWNGQSALPLYITSSYEIQEASLSGYRCTMLTPTGELATLPALRKQIKKIQEIDPAPVVLRLSGISAYRREKLIEDRIPFLTNKQAYLPFMGTFLTEEDEETKEIKKFMFSTQQLVLFYLYEGKQSLYISEATRKLPFTAMTMSRAVKQLEKTDLFHISKDGVNKVIASRYKKRELFEKLRKYLSTPVRRAAYLEKENLTKEMLYAGETALAEETMLNPGRVKTYAVDAKAISRELLMSELVDPDEQVRVELWEYDPGQFSDGKTADKLSIVLSFSETRDERVEAAVEEVLEGVWRE